MSDPRVMSIKELKAAVTAVIGEAAMRSRNFVEKSEFISFLIQHNESIRAKKDGITIVPAGKYILGDPCFMVTDVLHLEKFNETYYDSEEEEETKRGAKKAQKMPENAVKEARFDDSTAVTAFNTYSDDGPTWFSEKKGGRSFLINGTVVALVPLCYNPQFSVENGEAHVVEFASPAPCYSKRGILYFGDIEIDTKRPAGGPGRSRAGPGRRAAGKKRKVDEYEDDSDVEVEDQSDEGEEELFSDDQSSEDEWVPDGPRGSRGGSRREKRRRRSAAVQSGSSSEGEAEFEG